MSTSISFSDLGLAEPLLRAIAEAGYTQPTPIQAQAIPQVLQGGDLLAAAQTGTGKTAGFTLPILHLLSQSAPAQRKAGRPRCLILTPTRELTAQVAESVQTYGKYTKLSSMVMFGGVNINPQITALRKPLDILVATPGRLLDHAGQKTVDLSGVEILVLDEADRMLDMGFIRDIRKVLALLPKQRQNLLFSATFSDEIRELAKGVLHNPGEVSVARRNTASELVEQSVHLVAQNQKRDLISHIIRNHGWHQVLVFTRTKHGANRLAEKLVKDGLSAAAIHGNKSQAARTRALAGFKSGDVAVLVATDIAARGLDIDQLPQVVNFELPNVPEDYVHRIGRTGRAGASGAAISLVAPDELKLLKAIERLINRTIERAPVEGWTPSEAAAKESEEAERREPGRGARSGQRQGQGQRREGGNRDRQPRAPRTDRPAGEARNEASGNRPRQNAGNDRRPSDGQRRQDDRRPAQGTARSSRPAALLGK
ncbi:DEAD/DEAH box helicase [Corticimicrobacter populi]|uniref:DEAD/DEAH box helicase n=1 Tax=Corticimicrobacter populi TaxID=2175229 RepID=UPI00138FA1FD|nr:DEAD/DEAH box helicase [Corticimicrobacter populi]